MLFSSVKRLKRANMHFMYCEKVEKTFWFVIYSSLKTVLSTAKRVGING